MQYSTRSAARYVPATTFYEHSARNEGAYNLLQLNSFVGMTADATHMGTTARQSGSNASHVGSVTGAAAAPSSPGNPGRRPQASNRRNNWRPREVGRGFLATIAQQRLLLRYLCGLRCFRFVWHWSACVPLRPQSFPCV